MFLQSRDNAWNVMTRTAADIGCYYSGTNFKLAARQSIRDDAPALPWRGCHDGGGAEHQAPRPRVAGGCKEGNTPMAEDLPLPGDYLDPQCSAPDVATEPVCLEVGVMGWAKPVKVAFTNWQRRTEPPENHMESGNSPLRDRRSRKQEPIA